MKIKKAHFIGHSMGGFISIYLASLQPNIVLSLILCSTCAKQLPAAKDYLKRRIDFIDKSGEESTTATAENIRHAMLFLYTEQFLSNSSKVEEIVRIETNNPYPQEASAFTRQARTCLNYDAESILPDIACIPTCVIIGSHDRFYTPEVAESLAHVFTHSSLKIIQNAGHMIQIERPDALSEAVDSFIRSFSVND